MLPDPTFTKAMLVAGRPYCGMKSIIQIGSYDLVGFSLQNEVCYTNILTKLSLGGIPLHSKDRTLEHPLVICGGPGAQNPEILAPFIDIFVIGDGEESLPWIMERWMSLKERGRVSAPCEQARGALTRPRSERLRDPV